MSKTIIRKFNFEIQADHLFSDRGLDQVIKNKKDNLYRIEDFAVTVDHRVKFKKINREKSNWTLPENKKVMELESYDDTNSDWCSWDVLQRLDKGTWRTGNRRMWWDHPKCSITKIDQNPEKSPGDLWKLAVFQIPVKDHQLTLLWKTRPNNSVACTINSFRPCQRAWEMDLWITTLILIG